MRASYLALPSRSDALRWVIYLMLSGFALALVGCAATPPAGQSPEPSAMAAAASGGGNADALLIVDCLLPGQIRKLGRHMIYPTPRRPVKTSARDCEIRGGEYVAYDRSDYATALKVWLPQAKQGDKVAQTYVGEIYEKGIGGQPDYASAAVWYRKAAEQGDTRAQINLGHLYEKGLGVARDPAQALSWYRKAAGLDTAIALDGAGLNVEVQQELESLRQEAEQAKREAESLRQQLQQTRQQLEQTRQKLQQRQSQTQATEQELARLRQEVQQRQQQGSRASNDAALRDLQAQLQRRERELAEQRQETSQLQQHLTRLEQETEQYRERLSGLQKRQVALAGPSIEVIDPPLSTTRGLAVVKVAAAAVGHQRTIVGRVTAPAGLFTLTVNDREEHPDTSGLFRASVPMRQPQVPVKVVAIDTQGQRAAVQFQLTSAVLPAATTPPQPTLPRLDYGSYHALIIGNNRYQHWPNLNTPENDARKLAGVLGGKYGFQIRLLLNATRFDILQALNELRHQLTEKDNLLVYYAGHGYLDPAIDRGYWIPVDGDTDSNVNWISTVAITDMLGTLSAKHVLVVADSCYAGALTRSALVRLGADISNEARTHWLEVMAEKRSRTVLTSGDLQPVLDSGGGSHSVFAKALLDVLTENTEVLEGQRLHRKIAARVAYAASTVQTEQIPQYAPIKYAGHEAGDFLFVPTARRSREG